MSARWFAFCLNLPTLLCLGAILVYPICYAGYLSVHRVGLAQLRRGEFPFTGWENYGRFLDAHDFKSYGELFAKDGEWIGGFGSVTGPAAVEAFMVKNIGTPGKPSGTYHLLTNFIIDVHGDTATAWSRWNFVTPGADKKPAIAQGGHYEDTLVRENGHWKFRRREAFSDIPVAAK